MSTRALALAISAALSAGMAASAFADDGELLRKSMSSSPGTTEVPIPEAEHAFIDYMKLYVPAQSSDRTLVDIEYRTLDDGDGEPTETRDQAKPLVGVYIYGPVVGVDGVGFVGHGARDAFAAVSLDDGNTWKRTNLSESADKSSFDVSVPFPDPTAADGAADIEFDSYDIVIEEATWRPTRNRGVLSVAGNYDDGRSLVIVRNAVTEDVLFRTRADRDGDFERDRRIQTERAPCFVQAGVGGSFGPPVEVVDAPEDCVGVPEEGPALITEYPGDVINIFHAVAGNRVIVAWPSRYCQTGTPGYTLDADIVGGYLGIDNTADLYLTDLFGVAGSQGSVDYSNDEFEQNQPVGEVPFSCLWTARGVLVQDDETGLSDVVWFKPERLTSGRRDVNRVEIRMVEGAGAVVTWQEDPEGLRPGQGLGPGEGWSGAIANNQTDVWYSFLPWEHFDIVDVGGTPTPLADYTGDEKPGHYVPFAIPMRLTNNAKCNAPTEQEPVPTDDAYCYGETLGGVAENYGLPDLCADSVEIPQGQNRTGNICINEPIADGVAGLPNIGNTAATRPRLSLQPRDTDGDGETDSAWVVVITEEDKGFGRFSFKVGETDVEAATPCTEGDEDCEVADRGKNIWYFSFDMGDAATSAGIGDPTSLVSNIVSQGNMLNQAEVDWRTGETYPPMDSADMWFADSENAEDYSFLIYRTEIARRGSLLVQSTAKAALGESGLTALPTWKQGLLNQGGPADVMARRILGPGGPAPSECPIDVDPAAPVVISASYVVTSAGREQLEVTVAGTDGDSSTKLRLRNAVSTDLYGYARSIDETTDPVTYRVNVREDLWGPIPCAIQVADGDSAFGGWAPVTGAPSCDPEIPPECLTDGNALVAAAVAENGSENPYDFANMFCESWAVLPGTNPYYPKGLCADAAINLSGTTPETCTDSGDDSDGICPTIDDDGIASEDPADRQVFDKMLTWFQCPGSDFCDTTDLSTALGSNLDDQSWYNPLEVSKGHRGFLDGDFVMLLYAWSPNWKLNAVGRDRYELYIRRSFDGGVTWTTLPASYTGTDGISVSGDGTITCETMRDGDTSVEDTQRCQGYDAGADEQARNVSQLKSQAFTILDPRYAPTGPSIEGSDFETDERDSSRYFIVYETGDNTTTAEGEPEPLDLFYGRAVRYGDDYQVWSEEDTLADTCLPDGTEDFPVEDPMFCNEFDALEGRRDTESGEASVAASAAGDFLYSVWSQAELDGATGELIRTDAMFRRVWYLDDYIPSDAPIDTTQ